MSRMRPKRKKVFMSYGASLAAWFLFGPLGIGAIASNRIERGLAEGSMCLVGLGLALSAMSERVDADASPGEWKALAASGLLILSLAMWIGDFFRMKAWHGRLLDPLLDDPTSPP